MAVTGAAPIAADHEGARSSFFANARTDVAGPLDDVTVIDLTHAWAGPMAACLLADLGATVRRIELPGNREGQIPPLIPGTERSWFRESVNRNKLLTALDVRTPEGAAALLDLVADADIIIENFRPGTLDRWGIGYDSCKERNPGIVMVSITGFGQFGPLADTPSYDTIAQALSGWMALNGDPSGNPQRAPTYLTDDLAALHGSLGALAALTHRRRTGEGQHVDVALLDCLLFQSNGALLLAAAGHEPERMGNEIDGIAPSNLYPCADGHVYIVVAVNRHWRALATVIGRPELGDDEAFRSNRARLARRHEVDGLVAAWTANRTRSDIERALGAVGIAVGGVRSYGEAAADPHVRARQMVQPTELCDGSIAPLTGPPVKFSRTPTSIRSAAPAPAPM